jgi:hypothetical protein
MDSAALDLRLVRGQIFPRRSTLVKAWAFWLAILAGVAFATSADRLPIASIKISEAVTDGFAYASITLGACFSAIVLSLGLPGTERLRRWSVLDGAVKGKSALSDLIFVLVWAALAQILLILTCVFALIFGGDISLAPKGMWPSHRIGLFLGSSFFFYAVFELVTVVQTLSQMGVIIIFEERKGVSEGD